MQEFLPFSLSKILDNSFFFKKTIVNVLTVDIIYENLDFHLQNPASVEAMIFSTQLALHDF